ncbi:MAG: BMP family ABC transporter substrate-binding protein [Candidatus Bipolaricaulota bacterium]
MNRRWFVSVLVLAFLACPFVALPASADSDGIDLALVMTPPGKADMSWFFVHWIGVERAQELGVVDSYTELVTTEAAVYGDLTMLAESRAYDLIVVVSWEFVPALNEVAEDYPEQNFLMSDVRADPDLENVLSVLYQQEQPSALVGALAALLAAHYDYPSVGLVLGIEGPVLQEFEMGYKFGVNWAIDWIHDNRPELADRAIVEKAREERVLWSYTGAFNDPARGRAATEAQLAMDAGAVYQVAGATGLGVLGYIADYHDEHGLEPGDPPFAIGVDIPQEWMEPHIVPASALKRADVGVLKAAELVHAGEFRDRIADDPELWLNLANEGTWMSCEKTVAEFIDYALALGMLDEEEVDTITDTWKTVRESQPAWIWEAVEELQQDVIDGEVEVPRPFGDPEQWDIDELRDKYG